MAFAPRAISKIENKKRKAEVIITAGLPKKKQNRIEAKCKRKAALLSLLRGKEEVRKKALLVIPKFKHVVVTN